MATRPPVAGRQLEHLRQGAESTELAILSAWVIVDGLMGERLISSIDTHQACLDIRLDSRAASAIAADNHSCAAAT